MVLFWEGGSFDDFVSLICDGILCVIDRVDTKKDVTGITRFEDPLNNAIPWMQ